MNEKWDIARVRRIEISVKADYEILSR